MGATGEVGATGDVGATGEVGATGPEGATGANGFDGATGATGADALWNFTGAYNIGASYAVGDVATYEGETWYRIDANGGTVGNTPAEGTFWTKIAEKGAAGANGFDGATGATGEIGATGSSANLGNLYIIDETIHGQNNDQDIYITPAGTGVVQVPSLSVPTGNVGTGTNQVVYTLANANIRTIPSFSVTNVDVINEGDYGIPHAVTAPYTVFQLEATPTPALQEGDAVTGPGIPYPSYIAAIGTGTDANVIITNQTLQGLPVPPPESGTQLLFARANTNASLNISTLTNTDIILNPGIGGFVVTSKDVIPTFDNVQHLGSPLRRWKDLFLSAGSLYLLDNSTGIDTTLGADGGNLIVGGAVGLTVGAFTFYGNTLALKYPEQNITVGTQQATGYVQFYRPLKVVDQNNIDRFDVDRGGLTTIRTQSLGVTESAFSVIGSSTGNVQPRNFGNTLVQLTGMDNQPARISMDAFGIAAGQNAYGLIASRSARGTVDAPETTQRGDTLMRLTAQGWTGNGLYAGSIIRTNFEAAETFTSNTATGTRLHVQATPTGSNVIQTSATFYANGMVLGKGGAVSTGITFNDDTFQDTAYVPGQNVNSLNIGVGFQQSGLFQGAVNIDAAGVLTVVGTPDQITVANIAQNLTLSLPQSINTNSSPVFGNLTVTGNLYVTGNVFSGAPVVTEGINLYLGNSFTTSEGINTGGIVLGNILSGSSRTFLYKYPKDVWDTNGAGLQTIQLYANSAVITGDLFSNGAAHFGGDFMITNWPNAELQVDSNLNDFSQIISQNHSSGTGASTDFVATNDTLDGSRYINFGINSSTYNNPLYSIGGANSGYLYTAGGNLTIGTQTAGNVILFHTGNTTMNNWRANINDNGLVVRNMITSLDGITASANVIAPAFVGSGRYLTDLYSNANVASYLTTSSIIIGINANTTAANTRINTIDANVGNISIYTNSLVANAAFQATQINTFNANVGAFHAYANTALGSLATGANANTAAYLTTATINTTGNITAGNVIATAHYGNVVGKATQLATAGTTAIGTFLAGRLSAATGSVPKNSVATVTYTITGLTTNHKIIITPGTAMPDRQFHVTAAWASATNTVSIQYANNTNGAISVTLDINYFAFV